MCPQGETLPLCAACSVRVSEGRGVPQLSLGGSGLQSAEPRGAAPQVARGLCVGCHVRWRWAERRRGLDAGGLGA